MYIISNELCFIKNMNSMAAALRGFEIVDKECRYRIFALLVGNSEIVKNFLSSLIKIGRNLQRIHCRQDASFYLNNSVTCTNNMLKSFIMLLVCQLLIDWRRLWFLKNSSSYFGDCILILAVWKNPDRVIRTLSERYPNLIRTLSSS